MPTWKAFKSFGVALAAAFAITTLSAGGFAPENFKYKQEITFSGYSGTEALTDFPALVLLPTAGFKTVDMSDVAFADQDGNEVPYEVDSYDDAVVRVWVRVPSLSGTATKVTAWFGRTVSNLSSFTAADVWTNRYAAVWHLNEGATDSTGHGLQYLANNVTPVSSNGLLGRGYLFGSNISSRDAVWAQSPKDYVTNASTITVSGWFKPAVAVPSRATRLITWKKNTSQDGFDTFQNTNGGLYLRGLSKSYTTTYSGFSWSAGAWHCLVAQFNGSTFSAYLDGAALTGGATSGTESTATSSTSYVGLGNMACGVR